MQKATHKGQSTAKGENAYFEQKLSDHALGAFDKLCEECDRTILAELFIFLSTFDPIRVPDLTPENESSSQKPVEIWLNPLDSIDTALFPLKKGEIQKIVNRAHKMIEEIQRLKQTALVRRLAPGIPPRDLLGGSALPNLTPSHFRTILALPEIIKTIGKRKRPEYERRLALIYRHIHERTGQWHDAWVADILSDLLPDAESPYNEDLLKMWRKRHALVD